MRMARQRVCGLAIRPCANLHSAARSDAKPVSTFLIALRTRIHAGSGVRPSTAKANSHRAKRIGGLRDCCFFLPRPACGQGYRICGVLFIGVPCHKLVMAGLVPAIHDLSRGTKNVDARDKPGHDGVETSVRKPPESYATALPQAGSGRNTPYPIDQMNGGLPSLAGFRCTGICRPQPAARPSNRPSSTFVQAGL